MKKQITTSIVLTALACAAPVAAQDAPAQVQAPPAQVAAPPIEAAAQTGKPVNLAEMRHHIYVMEGALARAVDYGAKQLNRGILAAMPGVFMLEGEARAPACISKATACSSRRARADAPEHGVEPPPDARPDDAANQVAINELRRSMQGVTDPNTRASIERAVRQLERQAPPATGVRNQQVMPSMIAESPSRPQGANVATGIAPPPSAPMAPAAADSVWAKDPDRAYTEAVTRALVDSMIDYSTPMNIPADQWLTVAARDDEGRDTLAPQDPLEEVVTMIYRVKGSDLQLYRTGKIDRDEVRKRVQMTQF